MAEARVQLPIDDVLSDSGNFTVDDFKRLQHDVYSATAATRIGALRGWSSDDEHIERARSMYQR